jgi:flagellar M-ring protein FliF
MLDGLSRMAGQLARFWSQLGAAQKLAFMSIALLTIGATSLLLHIASEPDYSTLYANLTPDDAASILDELNTASVPFRLTQAGTAIQVPVERVYDLRLELAAKGMPSSGPVGFEVFDDAGLAMTPFQQQVHFRRALEGELERTIGRLQPVRWARVHINLPERSAFQRRQMQPTAAVVLGMAQGQSVTESEAAAITQLIAGAVDGLGAEHVTIVDSKGRLLAQPRSEGDATLAAGALDVQRKIEIDLAARAQTLLDAALGAGKTVVTIAATIERRRIEEQQERVNPNESAVVSTQSSEETRSTPSASFGGIPGTPSNLPGGAAPQAATAQNGSESITRETLNFDVSRSRSTTVVPMGEVQRLSIAVLVDGTYEPVATPEGQEAPAAPTAPVYKPRTAQEIETYTNIVKRAVGFDEKRGDTIEVSNVAFRVPLEELEGAPPPFWESPLFHMFAPGVVRIALALLGVLLLIVLVLRPALRQLAQSTAPTVAAQSSLEGGKTALDLPSPDAEIAIPISKDQARHVAEAMRQWLRE